MAVELESGDDLQVSREAEKWQEKHDRIETLSSYRTQRKIRERVWAFTCSNALSHTKFVIVLLMAVVWGNFLVDDIVETLVCDDNVTLHLMNGKAGLWRYLLPHN